MFKIEDHEKNIADLTALLKVEGVDQAKASVILQGLRDNYTEVITLDTTNTKKITDVNTLNEGLRSANMMLLTKLGNIDIDMNNKNKDDLKNNNNNNNDNKNDVMSVDDVAKSFL